LLAVLVGLVACGSGAPKRHPVFFGLNVPNPSEVGRAAQLLNATPAVVSLFGKLDTKSLTQALNAAAPPGVTPLLTLEPWLTGMKRFPGSQPAYRLSALISGRHDAELTAIAQQIKAYGRAVYLRFAHEMNGGWYPWAESANGNQPGQYKAAWRHVHDLFAPITGTQVHWIWSPNTVNSLPSSAPSLAELFPGDAYVDYVGFTAYEHHSSRPEDTFDRTLGELKALSDKPVLLAETGVTGPGKQEWLRRLGRYVESKPQIVGFVYFDTSASSTGATGNYNIDAPADAGALAESLKTIGAKPYP
jgi:hypothetical protein